MKRRLMRFCAVLLAGMLAIGGVFSANAQQPARQELAGRWLDDQLFVRGQITPADIPVAEQQNFTMIIDLRPDGESPDLPSSTLMAGAVKAPVAFHYIPVPHGAIADEAVNKLGQILRQQQGPILLYCRSGVRAARTWALAEASRPGGRDGARIMDMVRQAGYPVADLQNDIAARIAARASP